MKWKLQWFKVRSKTDLEPASSNTPCKQIQPLSRIKTFNGPRVRGISADTHYAYPQRDGQAELTRSLFERTRLPIPVLNGPGVEQIRVAIESNSLVGFVADTNILSEKIVRQ